MPGSVGRVRVLSAGKDRYFDFLRDYWLINQNIGVFYKMALCSARLWAIGVSMYDVRLG